MVDCTPDPNLLESMRSVGYSLNTAVADIIDNSIAAHTKTISIRYFDHGEDPYVAIIDDGDGMDYETAVNAMKLAGTNPNAKRNANDLGRFGLGLKTASLSQARSVMLSTVQHGRQNTLRWDLDHVARTREWDLETLDEEVAHTVFGVRHHNAHDFLPRMGRTIADTPFEKEQRDVMGDSNIPEDCG